MKEEKTYRLKDGGTITASSPAEFVTRLRESSKFDSEVTDQEYMRNFVHRYQVSEGIEIRSDSAEHFVEDLKANGYIL